MLSATILPCLLAGPAKATAVFCPFTKSITSTASPTAYILSIFVFIFLFTSMCPRFPKSIPLFFIKAVSGVTPIDNIIRSAFNFKPLVRAISVSSALSLKDLTPSPKIRFMPLVSISFSAITDISESKGAKMWLAASTRVTSIPFSFKFSAISIPIKPPPITTAVLTLHESTTFFILSVSGIFFNVIMRLLSMPSMGGFIGFAPGDSTR